MKELIKLTTPELKSIEESKAQQIKATFEPMAKMLASFEDAYNEVVEKAEKGVTKELTTEAKNLRLAIAKVRIETEKVRKSQKEEYLRAGKAIDGVSNILKWAVQDKENKLKEIEKYFEIQEKKRLEALQQERAEILSAYVEDAHERDLASLPDDVWDAYLEGKKKEHADRIAAERRAEEERVAREKAEAEERERIRKENEKLKAKIKAAEAEKERIRKEEQRKREEAEAKLRAEEEARRRAEAEAEAKRQAELSKGDEEKMDDLISDLTALKTKYQFSAKKNVDKYAQVGFLLGKIIAFIKGDKK